MFFREIIYFSCNKCGECCKSMDNPLTHYDIYRIFNLNIKFSPDTFITLYPSVENELYSVLLYENYNILYLSNKLSNNSCIFLNDENDECTIYESRPITCRTFPFYKLENGKLTLSEKSIPLVNEYCDKKRFKEHKQILKYINQGIEENKDYINFTKNWNKKVKNNPNLQTIENFINEIKLLLD